LRRTGRPGYRATLDTLHLGGRPTTRYVLAPTAWAKWEAVPEARVE